jgi:hypothetical protein
MSLGFAFATGKRGLAEQSIALLRSIQQNHPDAPIYVFLPESEAGELPDDARAELEDGATELLTGEMPIPEYPISARMEALRASAEVADVEYICLVDTDCLVLDRITVHEASDSDLLLKPVEIGRQFWGRDVSLDHWVELYDRFDIEFPETRVRSTFDSREILPCWNGGVVFCRTDVDLPDRWMDVTDAIHGEIPYTWHANQVALGMLSTEYTVDVLDERHNYPLQVRMRCPADVKILHYKEHEVLAKIWNRELREKIERTGIDEKIDRRSLEYVRMMANSASRWARRKTLPLNEEHALERAYNRTQSMFS